MEPDRPFVRYFASPHDRPVEAILDHSSAHSYVAPARDPKPPRVWQIEVATLAIDP